MRTDRAVLALAVLLASCGTTREQAPAQAVGYTLPGASDAEAKFAFDSLDERPVTWASTRGRPTVLVFATTGSLRGLAQVRFLLAMAKNDGDKVNYVFVALEPHANRALVEEYRRVLDITFLTALADDQTMTGAGPFGDVSADPMTIVLDRGGKVAFRAEGRVVRSEELREHLR